MRRKWTKKDLMDWEDDDDFYDRFVDEKKSPRPRWDDEEDRKTEKGKKSS